jgi:hypothetical protein
VIHSSQLRNKGLKGKHYNSTLILRPLLEILCRNNVCKATFLEKTTSTMGGTNPGRNFMEWNQWTLFNVSNEEVTYSNSYGQKKGTKIIFKMWVYWQNVGAKCALLLYSADNQYLSVLNLE